MSRKTMYSFFQLLLIFTFLLQSTTPFSMNAYVTVTYHNESSNYTTTETCECGVYGLASPLANAMGVVGIPKNGNYQACDYNTEFTNTDKPWIALIERGNCTFSEKIQTAGRRNADAVVIYNSPETGNQTIQMANFVTGTTTNEVIPTLRFTQTALLVSSASYITVSLPPSTLK